MPVGPVRRKMRSSLESMSRHPSTGPAIDTGDEVVRFEGVSMRYGRGPDVLSGLTFGLAPGSFHFVTGPSGAGKSSLLKLIYLAAQPSAGRIRLFGQDVSHPSDQL